MKMIANILRLHLIGWPAVPEVRRHYHTAYNNVSNLKCCKVAIIQDDKSGASKMKFDAPPTY